MLIANLKFELQEAAVLMRVYSARLRSGDYVNGVIDFGAYGLTFDGLEIDV